jgi:diketogulonate reductase-like aldo/keto reductase
VRDGKIRAYGVSNFDVDELEEAVAIAGDRRIACNQVLYHLGNRTIEHAVIPWCAQRDVAVVGYSPFGTGEFPTPTSARGKVLGEIAQAHGVTPRQVALRFLTRLPGVFAIPKASQAEHTRENAAAADLVLTPEEERRLDTAFPRGRRDPLAMH